jgi:pre-mRNA-splicing factor 18
MDFASLMAKEISKAKSPATPSPTPSSSEQKEPINPDKKYVRRAELEAARIAAYNAEQERLAREREERQAQKRKFEEEEAERRREREEKRRRLAEESRKKREEEEAAKERERRRRLGLPELPPAGDKNESTLGDEEEDIPDEELNQKLRELKEPICLFGENHVARLRRYRRLVRRSMTPQPKLTDGPIPTILEPVPEADMKIPTALPKEADARKFLFRQLASYFNMVLLEWERALARRDISVKQSLTGRQAYNAMVQSKENLKPLFRKFEKNDIDDNLLQPIMEIVHKAQLRRYVDANDAYLRVSIGKA